MSSRAHRIAFQSQIFAVLVFAITAQAHAAANVAAYDIVPFYSADDNVCRPLAKALTGIMYHGVDSTDILEHKGSDEILATAGFTLPTPLTTAYVPEQDKVYDLDLENDGRYWKIFFHNSTNYRYTWLTSWFVLKPGHTLGFASQGVANAVTNRVDYALPAEDVVATNFVPGKGLAATPVAPLDPKFRDERWQFRMDAVPDITRLQVIPSAFTRPVLYKNSIVYLLTSFASATASGGEDNAFALTHFTPELKLEALCIFGSVSNFENLATRPAPSNP